MADCRYILNGESYSKSELIDLLATDNRFSSVTGIKGVPNAPFKDTWHELVLKRMLRYAAENDYDVLGWTPGEVQAERYDLRKHIKNLEAILNEDGTYAVFYTANEETPARRAIDRRIPEDKLADYVGKELAGKIIEEGGGEYSGVDLEVGGEGMEVFYDQKLPSFINSYVKKWDGKLGTMMINTNEGPNQTHYVVQSDNRVYDEFSLTRDRAEEQLEKAEKEFPDEAFDIVEQDPEPTEVWGLPINNRMRSSVLETGQPLFSRRQPDEMDLLFRRFEPLKESRHQYQKRFDNFLRKYQDKMIDAKRIIEGVVRDGGTVTDDTNFYQDETLHFGRVQDIQMRFNRKHVNPLIDQLNQLYREHDLAYEDIRRYVIAKHAPERNELLAERNPDGGEAQSGMTNQKAAEILSDMNDRGLTEPLRQVSERVSEISEFILEKRVETGLMSQQRADELRQMYDHYVPLRGFAEHMDIDPTLFSGDLRAEGRSSEAGDVLAYLLAMADTAIISGEKNKVKQTLLEFVRENYERSDLFRIRNVYYRATQEVDEQTGRFKYEPTLVQPTAQELIDGTVKRELDPETEQATWNENTSPFEESSTKVMVGGRPFVIEFTKPHLAHAIDSIGVDQIPSTLTWVNRYMRLLRGLITQYNPEFGIRNLIRDSTTGFINLNIDFDSKTAAQIVNPVSMGKAFKALRGYLRNDEFTGEYGQALDEFLSFGSMTGFWELDTIRDRTRNLRQAVETGQFSQDWWRNTKKGFKSVVDAVDDYNRILENVVRVSTYKHLIDNQVVNKDTGKPYTPKQAANYARNLTVNFNRRGENAGFMGTAYLFFNAAVQGIARQAQPFFSDQTSTRWRAMAAPVVMGATAYMFIEGMRLGLGKDDDDEYFYDKINEWTRTHNLMLPNWLSDEPDDFIKVPLPYGYNVYWAAGDVISRLVHDSISVEEAALEMAVTTVDAYNPMGTASGKGFGDSAYKTFLPTVLRPGFELINNLNFAGSPIKPEPFPFAVEEPQSQQYFQYVSSWAKETAQLLNEMSGGDEVTSGYIDVSPEHIEYLVNHFGGGTARFFGGIFNTGENLYDHISGYEDLELFDIYDVPFARSHYGKVSDSATREAFINHEKQINQLIHQHEQYYERGQYDKARSHLRENKRLIALESDLKVINRQMRSLRKYRNQLFEMDPSREIRDKIKQIGESMHELQLEFNRRYNMAQRGEEPTRRTAQELIEE